LVDYDGCLNDVVSLIGVPVRDFLGMIENGTNGTDPVANVEKIVGFLNDGGRDC
jgi:hypothetical protein